MSTQDQFIRIPDREAFEKAFDQAHPAPKQKRKRPHWKYRRELAWTGWFLARRVPYVEPKCTLTQMFTMPLTPEILESIGKTERENAEREVAMKKWADDCNLTLYNAMHRK